jgi:uncharacterized protein
VRRPLPTQRARTFWLLVYTAAIPAANWLLTGSWLPPVAPEGLWFYTAAVSLLLGDLVVSPYYVGPKDTLSVAVPAVVALWFLAPAAQVDGTALAVWLTFGFSIAVASIAVVALLSASGDRKGTFSQTIAYNVSRTLGHPRVVLSAMFGLLLFEFHFPNPEEILLVGGTWAVLVGVQPERPIYWAWKKFAARSDSAQDFGIVVGYQSPGLLLIRQESKRQPELGDLLVCNDPRGPTRVALALDYAGRDEGLLLRSLEIVPPVAVQAEVERAARGLGPDRVGLVGSEQRVAVLPAGNELDSFNQDFLGIVSENTDVDRLYFEVILCRLRYGDGLSFTR